MHTHQLWKWLKGTSQIINVQENNDGNQDTTQFSQGAHIIVNNESGSKTPYTIKQMLGAHPIDDMIQNLNSTISNNEEVVDKELIVMVDCTATEETSQDFQRGCH